MKILFQKMLNEILKNCKNDICWCKSWCKTTRNKRTGSCFLHFFTRITFKTWNTMYQQACISYLILIGILSNLVLSIKKGVVVVGFYLMDKICDKSYLLTISYYFLFIFIFCFFSHLLLALLIMNEWMNEWMNKWMNEQDYFKLKAAIIPHNLEYNIWKYLYINRQSLLNQYLY